MNRIMRNCFLAITSYPQLNHGQFPLVQCQSKAFSNWNPNEYVGNYQKSYSASKLYPQRTPEIIDILKHHKLEYVEKDTDFVVKYCPFCPKPHKDKADNLNKLNVHKTSGCFFCFRCGTKGSWYDFKSLINNKHKGTTEKTIEIEDIAETQGSQSSPGITADDKTMAKAYTKYEALKLRKYPAAIKYLTGKDYEKGERGLSMETLLHYKIGIGIEQFRNDQNVYVPYESVYFPMYSHVKTPKAKKDAEDPIKAIREEMETPRCLLEKWKIRAINKENKHRQRVDPAGKQWYFLS